MVANKTIYTGASVKDVLPFFSGGKMQLVAETLQIHGDKARALFEQAFEDTTEPPPARGAETVSDGGGRVHANGSNRCHQKPRNPAHTNGSAGRP